MRVVNAILIALTAASSQILAAHAAPKAAPGKAPEPDTRAAILLKIEGFHAGDQAPRSRPLIEKLLKMNPEDSVAWRYMGDANYYKDIEGTGFAEARRCYQKAIQLDGENSSAFRMLGELYLVEGKYAQAVAYATSAINCKVPSPFAYRTRAVAYNNLHKNEEALKDIDQYLMLRGGSGETKRKWLMLKAGILEDAKHFDEAVIVYKNILKTVYVDDIMLRLAQCYVKANKPLDAIKTLDAVIAKNNEDEMGYLARGRVYASMKRYPEALRDYNKTIELSPLSKSYLERATIYDRLGDREKAKRDREKASEI